MATFVEISERVMNLLGDEPGLSLDEVQVLLQTRYEHMAETVGWSRRDRDFLIALNGIAKGSGTDNLTVTTGSQIVTSAGTPFTPAMEGRQIRIGAEVQYFFIKYISPNTIYLYDGSGQQIPWPRATDTNASWVIFQSIYDLPLDVNDVVTLASNFPLIEISGGRPELDALDANRMTFDSRPTRWIHYGINRLTGTRNIEVWPVPGTGSILRGRGVKTAGDFSLSGRVDVPIPPLVFGVAADACHLLHSKHGAEETLWENKALFFERKYQEVEKDYRSVEMERQSLPTELRRDWSRHSTLSTTDYAVNHQLEYPF